MYPSESLPSTSTLLSISTSMHCGIPRCKSILQGTVCLLDDIQAIGVHATGVRSRVEVGPLLAHPLIEIPQPSEFEAHPWAWIHPLVESVITAICWGSVIC